MDFSTWGIPNPSVSTFGIGKEFNGQCNLRFDDTNPAKEDQTYIDAIIKDVHWLGV